MAIINEGIGERVYCLPKKQTMQCTSDRLQVGSAKVKLSFIIESQIVPWRKQDDKKRHVYF